MIISCTKCCAFQDEWWHFCIPLEYWVQKGIYLKQKGTWKLWKNCLKSGTCALLSQKVHLFHYLHHRPSLCIMYKIQTILSDTLTSSQAWHYLQVTWAVRFHSSNLSFLSQVFFSLSTFLSFSLTSSIFAPLSQIYLMIQVC